MARLTKNLIALIATLSGTSFALPEKMSCRVATLLPELKEEKFEVPLKGGRTELLFLSPTDQVYRVQLSYNKTHSIISLSIATPKFESFEEMFHGLAPVTEVKGRISPIHFHLIKNENRPESLVVECPPLGTP